MLAECHYAKGQYVAARHFLSTIVRFGTSSSSSPPKTISAAAGFQSNCQQ
jgi:hypothetical protein